MRGGRGMRGGGEERDEERRGRVSRQRHTDKHDSQLFNGITRVLFTISTFITGIYHCICCDCCLCVTYSPQPEL